MKNIFLIIFLFGSLLAQSQQSKPIYFALLKKSNTQSYTITVSSYPVNVLDVNNQQLGIASTSSEFVSIWNGSSANQVKGILSSISTFSFLLSLKTGQTAPSSLSAFQVSGKWASLGGSKYLVTADQKLIILN